MNTWRFVLLAALLVLFPGAAAAAAAENPQNVASDSYYRLDPPSGTMTVRVVATVQNATSRDMPVIQLWAMPAAAEVAVTRDGETLEAKVASISGETAIVTVAATLPKPLKPGGRTDVVMTYSVPAQVSKWVRLETGAIESLFVSQGAGSFVWVDVPSQAENYFDPGCLRAAEQPAEVRSGGYERWVCGEATLIALSTDDPSVQSRCAGADDKCRQRLFNTPYSAFAQSITDSASRGTKEAEVTVGEKSVKLTLRYFRREEKWAEEQFTTAVEALPKLRALFGFEYGHPTLLMRQSHHIEMVGAAGIAFPTGGEVLLATDSGFDREVTVHELAHQWAGFNLESNWLWEGLAEYATDTLAPEMGIKLYDRRWQSFGYKDPLATWYNGSAVTNPNYWYGKSGAFWKAFEQAIGGREKMTAVLARMDDRPERHPLDGRWFMDAGEAVSKANLDTLFLEWVFNPDTASSLLAERRAAHILVRELTARASALGSTGPDVDGNGYDDRIGLPVGVVNVDGMLYYQGQRVHADGSPFTASELAAEAHAKPWAGFDGLPPDIAANLDAWSFGGIEEQVKKGHAVLDAYAAVVDLAAQAGLPTGYAVLAAWSTAPMAETASLIESQRQALLAIIDTSTRLGAEPEGSPGWQSLASAREKYAGGDFAGAKRDASLALTATADRATATAAIALAREKQASFRPGLLERIGMYFANPGARLDQAEAELASGDSAAAMRGAREAFDTWEGARSRGIMRLAVLAGVMAFFCIGAWYVLQRIDPGSEEVRAAGRKRTHVADPQGHELGEKTGPSWRDWENTR